MTTGPELFQEILEHPFDDRARLLYADWLEENGEQKRCDFIRGQIANQAGNGHVRIENGPGRITELAAMAIWDVDLKRVSLPSAIARGNSGNSEVVWRRGFVEVLQTTANLFIGKAKDLFGKHPITKTIVHTTTPQLSFGLPLLVRGYSIVPRNGQIWTLFNRAEINSARSFGDYNAAAEYLNDKLVAYGRELAGLTPLEKP